MARSTTLRTLWGLPDQPVSLRDSVLIMIDCQNTYRHGILKLDGIEPALDEAARLLARAREAGIPIIHIIHDAGRGSPYDTRAEIGQISDEVTPAPGEHIIVKRCPSAFRHTGLDTRLRETGRHDLVLAGFMTHLCVNATACDAFTYGYRTAVVAGATATRELPGPDGVPVSAATLKAAGLATISDLFGLVVGKADDIPD